PPGPADYRQLATRVVELHPATLIQNARTSGSGNVTLVPKQALSVGPAETWKADKVSIWHAGTHDNPFGQRLTTFMIAKKIPDAAALDSCAEIRVRCADGDGARVRQAVGQSASGRDARCPPNDKGRIELVRSTTTPIVR